MRNLRNHQQRGFVIVLALIALMAMSFFLMTGAATTTSTMKVSGNYTKTIDGFNVAEVGIAKARMLLETLDYDTLLVTYKGDALLFDPPPTFNGGTYSVTVRDNDDGDGDLLVDDDDIIIVTSIGRNASGGSVQIEAYMQKLVVTDPEEFPEDPAGGAGAGMLCGTSTDAKTIGGATIDGNDFDPPTLPCIITGCGGTDNGGDALAIVAEGALNLSGGGFVSDLSPAAQENIGSTECDQWKTLRDEVISLDTSSPHIEVLTGTGTTADLNDCTTPKVFIINTPEPTFRFHGNATLCGLVVVASNTAIEATGTVTIVGSVLVMGESADLSFVASSGTPRIFGQVIVESTSVDKAKELTVQGTADVHYSTKGIGYAEEAMNNALGSSGGGGGGGIITMAWQETY